MINSVRIMMYVDDVQKVADFWQDYFNATIIETNKLEDGSTNLVLKVTENLEFSFFSKAFIAKYSPEVLDNKPSLVLSTTNFDGIEYALNQAVQVEIINGHRTFNFHDPEDNYFVLMEV